MPPGHLFFTQISDIFYNCLEANVWKREVTEKSVILKTGREGILAYCESIRDMLTAL